MIVSHQISQINQIRSMLVMVVFQMGCPWVGFVVWLGFGRYSVLA